MSYIHFTLSERDCLEENLKKGKSIREIAGILGRSPSSVSRELRRNSNKHPTKKYPHAYNPFSATARYLRRRSRSTRNPLIQPGDELYSFIVACFERFWSPEVIAQKAKEKGFSISCSTIYRYIKLGIFGKITPKTHLRRRGKNKNMSHPNTNAVQPDRTIHDRPQIIEEKGRFGDFEGDTVYGAKGKGCLVTLVDRKSKLLAAARCVSRKKEDILNAFVRAFKMMEVPIPIESITLDNGVEFAGFRDIEAALNTTIYFADPHSPWQRGLNENTNDLIRFFFPKGTDFLNVTDEEVALVVSLLNNRPRKTLFFLSPLEFFSSKCCT